ncbi:LysR family transcriptional regulator [Pseudomonas sp. 5P_3.1_Bac2]|uniref:LysR family transcriptional regulator n=1 Tax=Pseudomonas sp. 5P_3.1_Bac2 TaxID=2971617 RepID=UPI0021C95DF3|nr:LysR family transcriptional regulator [Pseudomonas sp. 5P_3.1_Bac2]MCU1717258.1 LysR family transcriptional regulator [Pseudomonas sp. 5P_3.1_Bac2]
MDKLRALQVFVQVVDSASLTRAAQKLNMSVAMVSNYIKYLEGELGAVLLLRTTRKISITDFGACYYKTCRNIFDLLRESEEAASHVVENPEGVLNISMPRTFGIFAFLPLLDKFYQALPKIRVDVSISDELVDFSDNRFDAAVRLGALTDSCLVARPLRPYKLVLCAAPAYLEKNGVPEKPEDLVIHECIATYFDEHKTTWNSLQNTWEFLRIDAEFTKVSVPARMQVNDAQGVCIMVLSGYGIALLPELMVSDHLADGRLVELLPGYQVPSRAMHLVYRKSSHMPFKLKAFIGFIMEEFS